MSSTIKNLLSPILLILLIFQLGCSEMTTAPLENLEESSSNLQLSGEDLLKSQLLESIGSSSVTCDLAGVSIELAYALPPLAEGPRPARILVHGGSGILEDRDNLSEELASSAIDDQMVAISLSIDFKELEVNTPQGQLGEGFKCINDWIKENSLKGLVDFSHVELLESDSSELSELLLQTKEALLELKDGVIEGNVSKQISAGLKIVAILKGTTTINDVLKLIGL